MKKIGFWGTVGVVLIGVSMMLIGVGCEYESDETVDDPESQSGDTGSVAAPVNSKDLAGVTFIYGCDVSMWPKTITLTSEVSGPTIYLYYDVMQDWPAWHNNEWNVNANCWVIFTYKGTKYASTFDYLRRGQVEKESNFSIPTPEGLWRPSSGETIAVMVSGMARDARRTVNERSNVYSLVWP